MEQITIGLAFTLATLLVAPGIAWSVSERVFLGRSTQSDHPLTRWVEISVAFLPLTLGCLWLVNAIGHLTGLLSDKDVTTLLASILQLTVPLYLAVFLPVVLAFCFVHGPEGKEYIASIRGWILDRRGVTLLGFLWKVKNALTKERPLIPKQEESRSSEHT